MSTSRTEDSKLYNKELSPETASGTWKMVNLFNWWMSAWHSLGGYTMAIGLFVLGIAGWQVMLAFVIGVLRSEEHTSELQSRGHLVCRLLLEKKNKYRFSENT